MRRLLSERFPSLAERMTRLIEADETLRELCDDLDACDDAAARLEKQGDDSRPLLREYAALRLRLEHELLRHLEESGAITPDNGGASARPAKREVKGGAHRA